MNPWEIILTVLGWGVLAIIVLILAVAVIALVKAIPSLWRKPPSTSTTIFNGPDK